MNGSNFSLTNYTNTGSGYCKYHRPETEAEKIAKQTVFGLVGILGICLNLFVIIVAIKYKLQKKLQFLITNMAVSDALYLLVELIDSIPWLSDFKLAIYPKGTTTSVVICKVIMFIRSTSYKVSLITLLVISIERFRVTTQIMDMSRPYTLKRRMLILGVSWIIPMLVASLDTYNAVVTGAEICSYEFHTANATDFLWIGFAFSSIILCFVIFVLSVITIRRLSKPRAIQAHLNERHQNLRKQRAQAAVRMVLVSILLYTCCWVPYFLFNAFQILDFGIIKSDINLIDRSACIDWISFYYILLNLPVINSFFSPCIYFRYLSDFREVAKKALCRRKTLIQPPLRQNNATELQSYTNSFGRHDTSMLMIKH